MVEHNQKKIPPAPFFKGGIFALLSLLGAVFLLTIIRVNQLQQGYLIAKLEQRQTRMANQKKALQLELAVLKRPERIQKLAAKKLGLHTPGSKQVFRIP